MGVVRYDMSWSPRGHAVFQKFGTTVCGVQHIVEWCEARLQVACTLMRRPESCVIKGLMYMVGTSRCGELGRTRAIDGDMAGDACVLSTHTLVMARRTGMYDMRDESRLVAHHVPRCVVLIGCCFPCTSFGGPPIQRCFTTPQPSAIVNTARPDMQHRPSYRHGAPRGDGV